MTELDFISIDPVSHHTRILDGFEKGGLTLSDPTNPFIMLSESMVVTAYNNLQEIVELEKSMFPSLATKESELLPHIVEGDEINMFASPAKTFVRVMIELDSIIKFAVEDNNIYKATIPKNSFITVDDTRLTIMNDVNIFLNAQNNKYRTFVENVIDSTSIEFKNTGNIVSTVTVDDNNAEWVIFDIPVLQVTAIQVESIVSLGSLFSIKVPIDGSYYFSIIEVMKNGNYIPLAKTFSDTRFDVDTPSVYLDILEDTVTFKVFKNYIDSGDIVGNIRFTIYTTDGKVRVPLNKFSVDDFKFNLSTLADTVEKAAGRKLTYLCSSDNILDGGSNRRNLREMKKKLIFRTSGVIDTPITDRQLNEAAKLEGFTIMKAVDTVLDRTYIASRDINELTKDISLPAPIYTFNNRTKLEIVTDVPNKNIIANNDFILIKPNTIFKNNNGIITPITDDEELNLNSLTSLDKVTYLNNNRLLFTPFHYVLDSDIQSVTARVYDIDKPVMDYLTIVEKNRYLRENVNINGFNIIRSGDGYDLFFRVTGNEYFDSVMDDVKIQLAIKVADSTEYVYYHSSVDQIKNQQYFGGEDKSLHYVRIESDLFINDKNQIRLTNGYSNAGIKYVDIDTSIDIIVYYPKNDILSATDVQLEASNFLGVGNVEIVGVVNTDAVGFTKETINLTLADELSYLWRRLDASYTSRAFKTHSVDVPLTYDKNVFEKTDGCDVTVIKDGTGKCIDVQWNKLHSAGDTVVDAGGNAILKYKAGDKILVDGIPVPDNVVGISRMIDIFMLEYSYIAFKKKEYLEHVDYVTDIVRSWVKTNMVNLNEITLEQTQLLFRTRRDGTPIKINSGTYGEVISPTVTIYYDKTQYIDTKINEIKDSVGKIINKYFSKSYIVIPDLTKELSESLGDNVLSVKISNYLYGDPDIIRVDEFSNRFSIRKKIDTNFNIVFDYELLVEKI